MESTITTELSIHLLDLIEKSDQPIFFEIKHAIRVAEGVVHCEQYDIDWKRAVLSKRHLADGETLAVVMTLPPGRNHLDRDEIMKRLRIPPHVNPLDLGLPIEHPTFALGSRERHQAFLFLWINACFFMQSRIPAKAFV